MSVRRGAFFWICPKAGIVRRSISQRDQNSLRERQVKEQVGPRAKLFAVLYPSLPKTVELRADLLDEDEVAKHS